MAMNLMPFIEKAAKKSKKPAKKDEKKGKNWIAKATKNKGDLHKALGVPMGQKIPEKKLEKAEESKNPKLRKQAHLAETLKKFK